MSPIMKKKFIKTETMAIRPKSSGVRILAKIAEIKIFTMMPEYFAIAI
jgi:hypothetical protein